MNVVEVVETTVETVVKKALVGGNQHRTERKGNGGGLNRNRGHQFFILLGLHRPAIHNGEKNARWQTNFETGAELSGEKRRSLRVVS